MLLTSALPALRAELVTDVSTGEIVPLGDLEENLTALTSFVHAQTLALWGQNKTTLQESLARVKAKNPAEAGRQAGVKPDLTGLPTRVKAQSRVERLIRFNLVSTARSYFESSNLLKQEPSFPSQLNLGAVDTQMASLRLEGNQLMLRFKCWLKEYDLFFTVPKYVLERNLNKFSLPTIRKTSKGWVYQFTVQENVLDNHAGKQNIVAGVDLGRVEPFTLAIVHERKGSLLAQYTASNRLRALITKRDRLNQELGYLRAKAHAYENLGLETTVLEQERKLTRRKRNRLLNAITWQIGTEVATKTAKHSPKQISLENLSWVSPKHGMSRWTHSKDQAAITHKLKRVGIPVKKVSPSNTSQDCSKCGDKVIHQSGKRLVVCKSCQLVSDRDLNAAVNISLATIRQSQCKRSMGHNSRIVEPTVQVMVAKPDETVLSSSLALARKTR